MLEFYFFLHIPGKACVCQGFANRFTALYPLLQSLNAIMDRRAECYSWFKHIVFRRKGLGAARNATMSSFATVRQFGGNRV